MVTSLALLTAICFGSADFFGGIAARRRGALVATTLINMVGAVLVIPVLLFALDALDAPHALAAGCAGIIAALTIALIYAAFAAGAMSLAAPLIACGAGVIPTLVAIARDETPGSLQGVGIVLALAAVLAITWPRGRASDRAALGRRALVLSALAALGSGANLAVLQLAVDGGGTRDALAAGSVARVTAFLACLAAVGLVRPSGLTASDVRAPATAAGLLDGAGTILFLIASAAGNSAVVAVLVSLYAIATVALAQLILKERLHWQQALGILTAALGVALMSVGSPAG